MEQFLEKGIDVNAVDAYGRTPLIMADMDLELIRWLVARGADVSARDQSGETAPDEGGICRAPGCREVFG